jgi:uncharacterized protein (DUF58 family)
MDEVRRALHEGERAGQRYALGQPRRVLLGAVGTALGPRAGSSLEFKDHRPYEPGDDLRHVDWSAYARTDQLSVKVYREEVTPHLDIVLDGSRSMALEGTSKLAGALALAGLFATAARNAGYAHSAWLMGGIVGPVGNGTGPPMDWQGLAFEHRGPPASLSEGRWLMRGVRVLLSDLLWDGDPLATLRPFAERATTVVVVQVLADLDVHPPEGRALRLVDVETEQAHEIHVDAAAAGRYQAALARHQENWHLACRQVGAVFTSVVAEALLRDWRLDELLAAEVLRVV